MKTLLYTDYDVLSNSNYVGTCHYNVQVLRFVEILFLSLLF